MYLQAQAVQQGDAKDGSAAPLIAKASGGHAVTLCDGLPRRRRTEAMEDFMGFPVVQFEIGCRDVTRAGTFYSTLFGWTLAPSRFRATHGFLASPGSPTLTATRLACYRGNPSRVLPRPIPVQAAEQPVAADGPLRGLPPIVKALGGCEPPGVPMKGFRTTLVRGSKPPYDSWTFLIIPPELASDWGLGRIAVRGTISGTPFRGTAARGEGQLRIPIPKDLRERAGVAIGDTVDVEIERDTNPRPLIIPDELRTVFSKQPDVARLYEELPPSHRRAWAEYVGEAKRPETRVRRAQKAPDGIRARHFPR